MRLDHYALIFILALILALGFLVPDYLRQNKQIKHLTAYSDSLRRIISLSPEYDTIYLDSVIYAEIPKPYPVVRIDTVVDTVYGKVVKRTYQDSIPSRDVTIFYDAQTYGSLVGLDIWYDIHAPTQIIKTVKIPPPPPKPEQMFRAYASMTFSIDKKVGVAPGLDVVMPKWGVGYSYDIVDSEHNIKISRRLY